MPQKYVTEYNLIITSKMRACSCPRIGENVPKWSTDFFWIQHRLSSRTSARVAAAVGLGPTL